MEYGCIGERLPHSFSKEIHERIGDYRYELKELAPDEVRPFLEERAFYGINVTIPYKQTVLPYLDVIDEEAAAVGAVNTIVCRSGKLYGYNTDVFGMRRLIEHAGIDVCGKKALVLGTGGTSKTACAVLHSMGASAVIKVSRTAKENAVAYEDAYASHSDADILINTTPVGMFPNVFCSPADISRFPKLAAVVDAVYNPLVTELAADAGKRGLIAVTGLYMLVAQAVRACEIFMDVTAPVGLTERIYSDVFHRKQNIVLTGMPGCGKSTIGNLLAKKLGRPFYDTDDLVREAAGMEIADIFSYKGELYFRDLETQAAKSLASRSGCVIATGGGAVLRKENVQALKMNGKYYFIDRSPRLLIPTPDRPLALSEEAILQRYNERYRIYMETADARIDGDLSPEAIANEIERRHLL